MSLANNDYYTTPGHRIAYAGRSNVSNYYNKTSDYVNQNILSKNKAYTLHREVKPTKHYNPYFVYKPREQFEIDLADVRQLSTYNDGVNYLLTCIDIFTKKAWVRPMKQKTALQCQDAMRDILRDIEPFVPKKILCDRGSEFMAKFFRNLMREYNIEIILPNNSIKAAHVERFNKTIKRLIYTYLTDKETNVYINVLEQLVKSYNSRPHRSIGGLTPNRAELKHNLSKIRNIQFDKHTKTILWGKKQKPKFRVGDIVRISKAKSAFTRAFHRTFTEEKFVIVEILTDLPIITYRLVSKDRGDDITGRFYQSEMQYVGHNRHNRRQ